MKSIFYFVVLLTTWSLSAQAQTTSKKSAIPLITINAKLIGKDSVVVPFTVHYWVVQDSCAQITRYGHYDFKKKTFLGKFKDVRIDDSTQIIAKGSYAKGLKNGLFTLHYWDGKLKAQGNFKDNKMDGEWVLYYPNGTLEGKGDFKDDKFIGKWELHYDDGSPKLFFDIENGICKIMNAWSVDGVKTVNEGKGNYQTGSGVHWSGLLANGLPDSTWTYQLDGGDVMNASVVEYFNQNKFVRGHAGSGTYSQDYIDASHISLMPPIPRFDLDNAQNLIIVTECNGKKNDVVDINIWGKILHQRAIDLKTDRFK